MILIHSNRHNNPYNMIAIVRKVSDQKHFLDNFNYWNNQQWLKKIHLFTYQLMLYFIISLFLYEIQMCYICVVYMLSFDSFIVFFIYLMNKN